MFSVCYLFGLALFVWVNSGGACVVTHNYCVRHSHSRDCTFKINSSGLRQFRFELMCEYHSFVWKWRVKLTRPISVSCLIIYITPQCCYYSATFDLHRLNHLHAFYETFYSFRSGLNKSLT